MIDSFLFIGLPYIAIVVCIAGTFYRLRSERFSQSALSSQFLESNKLVWGSMPWHIGIGVILLAHVFVLVFPGFWYSALLNPYILYVIEGTGVALATLALVGLVVLLVRRITSAKIQAVTTSMDLVILFLLIIQVGLGLITAATCRWGALWAPSTVVPYMWSLFSFRPESAYVDGLPLIMKGHIVIAWFILLLIPFSRLVHIFALPLDYLVRSPQKVVWTNPRHEEGTAGVVERQQARRYFLRGCAGLFAGGALLSVGAADKLGRFFFGPRLSEREESELMAFRVKSLEKTVEEKKYELERQQNDYIFVAHLSELSPTAGKYFIDYQMSPALAFCDTDGLPLLISAKCTHLGCTVGADANPEGKILCPCHVSYFDIHTGQPTPDSPAKAPLPFIGWVLMDQQGKLVASKSPGGEMSGKPDSAQMDKYSVFIAKYHGGQA